MAENLYKKADLLFDKFKEYIILDFSRKNGKNYYLSDDATQEAIEAEKEYRSFALNLEPIR
ncbi:hypothetical protein ACX4ZB_01170 [Aerococcus urinae]